MDGFGCIYSPVPHSVFLRLFVLSRRGEIHKRYSVQVGKLILSFLGYLRVSYLFLSLLLLLFRILFWMLCTPRVETIKNYKKKKIEPDARLELATLRFLQLSL